MLTLLFFSSFILDPNFSALQRLRGGPNVEDDIEEMRIEDRAQKEEARVRRNSSLSIIISSGNFKLNTSFLPLFFGLDHHDGAGPEPVPAAAASDRHCDAT